MSIELHPCERRYSFMSPQRGLCGFLRTMNPNGFSFRRSRSPSFRRKVLLASVFVISSCFPSFSVS